MRFVIVFLLGLVALRAAPRPANETYSLKERAQGYSDRVVLAKPRFDPDNYVALQEAQEGVRVREALPRLGGLRIIEVDPQETIDSVIARLQASGRYEFVEPDYLATVSAVPDDPGFVSQWPLNNIGAVKAWDSVHDAAGVIVAVIDTGVKVDHADLATNLWVNPAPTFGDVHGARIIAGTRTGDLSDKLGHGTRVASIIGAVGNNGIGMTGVAWRVQLMILKHSDNDEGTSSSSDSARCIDYAVAHGAAIINCSFAGDGFSQTLLTAIQAARAAGVIVVTAASNDGRNIDLKPAYPAAYLTDNVVSVGNSTATDEASSSSNFGTRVELFAPGTNILALDQTGSLDPTPGSGTSFSAPHVAGAFALLRTRFPTDTYRQLINRALRTVDVKTSLAGKAVTNGRLNLAQALASVSNRPFNDDFANRAIVAGSTLAARANNTDATTETGEPTHGGMVASNTLWWQWVATSSGAVSVDTSGSGIDTTLAVFTGSTLNTLAAVATDDDSGPNQTSRVVFAATSGTSYSIAISSKTGATGYIQLNLGPGPANDNFANAALLSGESATVSGRNDSALAEPREPAILGIGPNATLWYKWIAPRTGRFQVSGFTTDFDLLLAVYTGGSVDKLTLVAANDDTGVDPAAGLENHDARCTLNAVGGTTYYIQVDTKSAAKGAFYLTVTDSLWQFSTHSNSIYGSAAIGADGTIYVGTPTPDRRLYAIAPDGTFKWSHVLTASMGMASPAIGNNGRIFVGAADGSITALNSSGTEQWRRKLSEKSAAHSIAVAADGTLYAHALDGYLYALNPSDGTIKWYYSVGTTTTYSSAVVAPDGTIYQASDEHLLYALNPNGTLKWRSNIEGTPWGTPALDQNGNIYLTTYENSRLLSVDPGGVRRWTYQGITATNSMVGSPALSANGDTVYVGAWQNGLLAVDAMNGALRWRSTAALDLWSSSPAVDSNGIIYVGCWDGKVCAIYPTGTLKRTWDTAQTIEASPIINGTTLYLPSCDAKLYAFDIGAYAAAGPWPQFRHNARSTGRADGGPPAVVLAPTSHTAAVGTMVNFTADAAGQGPVAYQWQLNGSNLAGATSASLSVTNVQPGSAGIYAARIDAGSSSTSTPGAILGLATSVKLVGRGQEFPDIFHPGTGFTYDQILLGSGAVSVKADPGQILRLSFVDLTNDIVQVEFSGAGTLSLVLDNVTGPAQPVNYNQNVNYMKGHAGIVLAGADATTNLSVFSVGRANAANPTLFKDNVTYDGYADIAFIAITSTDGKFGGLRTANVSYIATKGTTGLYAPDVEFTGPVFIGDIRAEGDATPTIVVGAANNVQINGGDLLQGNGRAVQVSGLTELKFVAGSDSHGTLFNAQANRARLEEDGADVTTAVVVNSAP